MLLLEVGKVMLGGGGSTSSVADVAVAVAVAEECCASAIATGAGAE